MFLVSDNIRHSKQIIFKKNCEVCRIRLPVVVTNREEIPRHSLHDNRRPSVFIRQAAAIEYNSVH